MSQELQWFIGIAVTVLIAILGAVFNNQNKRISELEQRIIENRNLIDGVKETFVRRIDTDRLDHAIEELRKDVKELGTLVIKAIVGIDKN